MSNGLEKPPEDIPPDQLFRLLIRRPYPVTPIDLRIRGAESIALSVRAITWEEEMEIQDLHSQKKVSLSIGYITKCLMADGEQAFSSFEQTSMLSESEIKRLHADWRTSNARGTAHKPSLLWPITTPWPLETDGAPR